MLKQGKYVVVDGKYVHSSKVKAANKPANPQAQMLCALGVTLIVVAFGYMASFCI